VGNWSARKGVDLLAPIMERLGNDFVLQYTADRNGAHTRFRLPPNSVYLGRLAGKDLVRAYQEADALLFPSRLEGLPLVPLEAMACGLPVIAANDSSLPEVVEDSITGLLLAPNAVEHFASACQGLATNLNFWRRLCVSAREKALSSFNEDALLMRYLQLYRSIL
jgi:glycosyltransferase involved in cell wall biosynthesis